MRPGELVEQYGGCFSRELGIDLASGKSADLYKWFLAAVLFGARISKTTAIRTYHEIESAGILTPEQMLDAGWNKLVDVLDRGGYARYDFKTATKLMNANHALMEQYDGDLNVLYRTAADPSDLERRIAALGKGIGEVTVNIFLRELRGIWRKAGALPSQLVIDAAHEIGILPKQLRDKRRMLEVLMDAWRADGMKARDFPEFEAALVRYGLASRRMRHGQRVRPFAHVLDADGN